MKKKINYAIIALIAVVLIWGVAAPIMQRNITNSKTSATYDKDGKRIVSYEVEDDEKHLYVQLDVNDEIELISQNEQYKRTAKNRKILMDDAKDTYNDEKNDENLLKYNQAVANYELAKKSSKNYSNSLFVTGSSTFFGVYVPIIVLLFIAMLINTKLHNDKENN